MKNLIIIGLFVSCVLGLYAFFFYNVEKTFDEPTEPYHLVSPSLQRNVAYFQIHEEDSTIISVYKCVGKLKNEYVIMHQWPIDITKGSNFKSIVNEYTKSKMFLFDYTHPVNEKELKLISQSKLEELISKKHIIYLENKDVRSSMANGNNKMFLFYLYPFGTLVLILLYTFLIRSLHFIGDKIQNSLTGLGLKVALICSGIAIVNYLYFTLNGMEAISLMPYLTFSLLFIIDYISKKTKVKWSFGASELTKIILATIIPSLIAFTYVYIETADGIVTTNLKVGEKENVTAISDSLQSAIWSIGILLVTSLPFILANFINNCINYFQEKKRAIDLLTYQKKDTEYRAIELDNLMARMNPHFLFNGLNSIASLATIDAPKTEKMAIALADFYKYASNRENKSLSSVREELDLLDSYLDVEQIRYGEKLVVSKTIDETVLDCKIPFMILQPLVENAVKHGYGAESDKINIDIKVDRRDEHINIFIFDKGKPFSDEMQTGFGLHSISRKLLIIYDDRFELKMINEPSKHVFLRIPNSVNI
jgi:sensor histidine kinase YesM